MTRVTPETTMPEIEALLAIEREIVPEADALRSRVLERARAALPRNSRMAATARVADPRRVRIGVATAAVVMLSVFCAAAFYAGYRVKATTQAEPSAAPLPAPLATQAVDIPSTNALSESTETAAAEARVAPVRSVGTAKPPTEMEAYAMELRLLQPARLAVARQDFSSALGLIAEHQRKFANGKLTEEREALRVKSLLGLGRVVEARRAGAAFRDRFPRSALLARIDEMLGQKR